MLLYQTYCLISSSEVQSNGVFPVRLAPAEMSNSTVGRLLMVAASWRGGGEGIRTLNEGGQSRAV